MKDLINKLKLNNKGGVGGLGGLILCFLFIGAVVVIMGKVFDSLVTVNNRMAATFPMSQDSIITMGYLTIIFGSIPFIYLIFLVINHIMNSNSDVSGEA